jgi:hypothetical protein
MQNSHRATPLLHPIREVTTCMGKVEVRELSWERALEFLKMLSSHSRQFVSADGKFNFNLDKMAELVSGASELSTFLLKHSVCKGAGDADGKFLGDNFADVLPFSEGLVLLDAALEINLSPEILALAKKTAARFAPAAGNRATAGAAAPAPKTMPSPESSTSSSGKTGATEKS